LSLFIGLVMVFISWEELIEAAIGMLRHCNRAMAHFGHARFGHHAIAVP
jgi:hypothetical protein